MLLQWAAQEPPAHLRNQVAHIVVNQFLSLRESRGELHHVHLFDDDPGELCVRFDVFQIDGEVVGGIAETIGSLVSREDLASLLRHINPEGIPYGLDIFINCQALQPGSTGALVPGMGQGVDLLTHPDRS